MAKVTFEFDYHEDAYDLEAHAHVNDMMAAIFNFKNELRSKLKYGELTDEQYVIYEQIRDNFIETLSNHGVLEIVDQ